VDTVGLCHVTRRRSDSTRHAVTGTECKTCAVDCKSSEVDSESVADAESTRVAPSDDDCLSISTSLTVVISRRSATVNAKVHAAGFASDKPEVEMATSTQTEHDSSTSPHVTSDVIRVAGSCRPPKRKSLESVIKSLQPTPVVTSRQSEVARPRPEVLVRPMQAARPVSTETVRPIIGQLFTPYSQPEVVDLRRPTGSSISAGVGRRKPKSLSPLQAPPVVDSPYLSDKRRRVNSGSAHAPWLPWWTPAARYASCMLTARPVYYGTTQQRAEPNGYDAPLELTTPRARDRK